MDEECFWACVVRKYVRRFQKTDIMSAQIRLLYHELYIVTSENMENKAKSQLKLICKSKFHPFYQLHGIYLLLI